MVKGEFTEKAAIGFGRERLVGARVESRLDIAAKQEGASHCLVVDDVYAYRKRRGRSNIVVDLIGHSGLSVCAE